ncbi:MAG: hypothetical protein CO021_00625 [Deltaproteobacteria bacterium CG_4_9_14_0_2_um_filter_42_21]|nr:MAG: hypothetical protein CO021_00625 [Deltaproteobacteria bacterium CG_4_9_14_0_2_um_filter_42_21]
MKKKKNNRGDKMQQTAIYDHAKSEVSSFNFKDQKILAGFWIRLFAFGFDCLFLGFIGFILVPPEKPSMSTSK